MKLTEFKIPKAHNSIGNLRGLDVAQSTRHNWVEEKIDGVRTIVHLSPEGIVLHTRRLNKEGVYTQFQDNVPHITEDPKLQLLASRGYSVLDGEIVIADDEGRTLGATMAIITSSPERAAEAPPAVLYLFDMPYRLGRSLMSESLRYRAGLLRMSLQSSDKTDSVRQVPALYMSDPRQKREFFDSITAAGGEGLILKDPDSGYNDSKAWLKMKGEMSVDARVYGYQMGKGKYVGTIGSLLVEVVDKATGDMRSIAKVAPGSDEQRAWIHGLIGGVNEYQIRLRNIIVELGGQGWTKNYRIRHPRILRYRPDRSDPNTVDFTTLERM